MSTQHKAETATEQTPQKRSKRFTYVLIALVVVGATFGVTKYIHSLSHEETDDAQIDGDISPVIPRVSGYIGEVRVNDNQLVKKGDTLLILDNRDEKIKVSEAIAALASAQSSLAMADAATNASQANIATTQANTSSIDAQIASAKVNVWRTTEDYKRYSNLIKDHTITEQQYEQATAAKQTAEHQLQVLEQQKNAAVKQTSAAVSQSNATQQQIGIAKANVQQRQAELDNAQLNLSYTVITAPEDGMVSKINVQPGQYVQAGQALFSVIRNRSVWVIANFKETQLEKMKVGQTVIVHVDAYPGHKFEAKLTSFAPATGNKFALLPPDNATGNFVKVVQRLPVKIEFSNPADSLVNNLRPGMNVDVDVHLD
jgi:membrane fusion protein (multidrug efflux system)